MRMDSRWSRVARGGAAATFATLTAAVSHGLAGGIPPTVFGLVASLVISGMVATVLAGRRLSWVRLTLTIGISQVLFHALFSGLGTPVVAEHVHAAGRIDALTATHDHQGMWLAHVAAGVVTLLAFRYGEVAFWGMARLAQLLVSRLVRRVIPSPASLPPRLAPVAPLLAPLSAVLVTSMRDRGPPPRISVA
jgi:hypothetical protein